MIQETNWYGFSAYQLENEAISTIVVPDLGGKIVSIYDKRYEQEWLSKPTRQPKRRKYADTFTDYEVCGWDEMFPTIDACTYPLNETIDLPDHGEVWSIAWEVIEKSDNSLLLGVQGQCFAYQLQRRLTLQDDTITLQYHLTNTSQSSIIYLWAAHPLFVGNTDTRIVLPDTVKSLINIIQDHPIWGDAGKEVDWNIAQADSNLRYDISRVTTPDSGTYRKFYMPPEQRIDHMRLEQIDKKCALQLNWDSNVLPYFGIWVDEGLHTRQTTIAPEPSNGFYDSLTRAHENKSVLPLGANDSQTWELKISLS